MLPDSAHLLLAESFHTTNYFCFLHLHLYTLVSSTAKKGHTAFQVAAHHTEGGCHHFPCSFHNLLAITFLYGGKPFVVCRLQLALKPVKRNVNSTHTIPSVAHWLSYTKDQFDPPCAPCFILPGPCKAPQCSTYLLSSKQDASGSKSMHYLKLALAFSVMWLK